MTQAARVATRAVEVPLGDLIECFVRNSIIACASRVAAGEDRTPDLRIMDLRAANCATAAVASVIVRALSRRKSKCYVIETGVQAASTPPPSRT